MVIRRGLMDDSPVDIRNSLLILIAFFASLRISEVVKLTWPDVYRMMGGVWLHIAPSKKQDQWEWVPLVAHTTQG
jgi:hypothetical protein